MTQSSLMQTKPLMDDQPDRLGFNSAAISDKMIEDRTKVVPSNCELFL